MRDYEARREALRQRYLGDGERKAEGLTTGGVDHLALICSDIERTIEFYTRTLGMRLVKLVANRDDPTSTHIFLDMGGGNLMAFFDFPKHGPAATVRGIGSMHHVALKAEPSKYQALLRRLDEAGLAYSIHGDREAGSVYLRDPDSILIEVTTGY